MGSNETMFGGGGWLFAFVILILLLGGGSFGGGDVDAKINAAINNQTTQNGIRDILLSSANNNYETAMQIAGQNLLNEQQRSADQINIIQGFNQLSSALAGISNQLSTCCCDIKTTLLQSQYDDALRELNKAQAREIAQDQTQYLLSVMGKWVANAPAA